MSADFTPNYVDPGKTGLFKFWCQKVLPMVYDDSLSYYELLCKVVNYLNEVIKHVDTTVNNVNGLYNAYIQLQTYVNNYFDSLDYERAVDDKISELLASGALDPILTARAVPAYNALLNRKFLLLADSYGMRNTPSWTTIFTSINGIDAKQKSVSSRGFTIANNSFLMGAQDFAKELSQTERTEITDIVVCGGWNDARALTQKTATLSSIQTAIMAFVDYCEEMFPNATPWIGFIAWQTYDNVQPQTNITDLLNVRRIYCNTRYKRLRCLQNVEFPMRCSAFMDESLFHPNADGAYYLYYAISSALFGGNAFSYQYAIPETSYECYATTSQKIPLIATIENSISQITMDGGITFTYEADSLGDGETIFLQFDKFCLPYGYNRTVYVDLYFQGTINNEPYKGKLYASINTQRQLAILFPQKTNIANGFIHFDVTIDNSFA